MQVTRLLLIRHAETSDPETFHGAESDIGLSAWGRQQSELLGQRLKGENLSALYCSAMRRAVDTATPVARACQLEPMIIPELHERKIGPLSGMSRREGWDIYAASRQHWMTGDIEYTHPEGESFAAIRSRVLPIVARIAESHRGYTVAVIAHGIVIRVLLLSMLDSLTLADFDRIAIDFASINDLRSDGDRWRAHALNEVIAGSRARPVA